MATHELPTTFTPAEIGKACNMSRRAAKSLLRGAGIAECGDGGRWFVRAVALRERLPDVFERVRKARLPCFPEAEPTA